MQGRHVGGKLATNDYLEYDITVQESGLFMCGLSCSCSIGFTASSDGVSAHSNKLYLCSTLLNKVLHERIRI